MPCLPISYENLASVAETFDPAKPIFMLNLWRYRDTALYSAAHAHLSTGPCTGEEAMKRYRAALGPFLPPNAAVHFMGTVLTGVVVPDTEKWDVVVLVRYETLEGFRKMVDSEEYKKNAEGHRLAALDDFRLIMLDNIQV
ncbi:hypothetical protein GQ44DRAFT_758432 [Phaeosphaeriaceae sp. PMI808]|nr:hypothetical protein GQ44DRAFT_758432 [Phaeosphaeriaceae sp. PMI808]